MIPQRLLRSGDSPELHREHDGVQVFAVWRGRRRPRRVATITVGQRKEQLPPGLLGLIPKYWPRPGTSHAEDRAAELLTEWAKRAGGLNTSWLDLLVGNGYLVRYQPLSSDGLTPDGVASLSLGRRGQELLEALLGERDDVHRKWVEHWLAAVAAIQPIHAGPGVRLVQFLQEAASAISTDSAVHFPGDVFSPGTARQTHTQIALDFLVAMAARVGTGEPFDWKEVGAHYRPAIGASKQFDSHQQRLLLLLHAVTGVAPSELGLVSLGSLYSLFGAGELTYCIDGMERITPSGCVWSLSSDELETLTLVSPKTSLALLTENRAMLLKTARTGWAHDRRVLVLGIDGQPRTGLRRLLSLLTVPLLAWVDSDSAGLSIGELLSADLPRLRWVLPPLASVVATEVGTIEEWRERMVRRLSLGAQEQELIMDGPRSWDLLLSKIRTPDR